MSNSIDENQNSVEADKQRLKRSEVLLTKLYRDEIRPGFQVPEMHGVRFLAIFSLLALILFTGTMFYKFNSFILLRESVMAKAGNLASSIQRRSNLFSNLINLTLNHASLEHEVFISTAKMRTEIIKKSKLPPAVIEEMLTESEAALKSGAALPKWNQTLEALQGADAEMSLGRLLAVVEQYPNIKSAETYKQAMLSLVEMEDIIATRRIEYNTMLREYNTAISKFPWKLLAHWTNFKRFEYYTSNASLAAAPHITKDTFQRLLPGVDATIEGTQHRESVK